MNNLEIIKSLYRAFDQGDLDTILDLIAPNMEWFESEGIPYGGKFIGKDAVVTGVFQKIGAEWDNFRADVEEFIDAGEKIIALGYDSGIYKATGKSMTAPNSFNMDTRKWQGNQICSVH
ncbi:hypothetical protein Sta7437_1154 [Stanieria cyanosphaera PCC 7437]|uniref:SnoaL-like domain-containing protein n=1 Tax=Stanieria cyanosphaera (strain ATCC 29371 / PCC 7437) TaxID=111780 RepID=K9XQ28_STAC7|nr:nuclear transport factor 2 family protein [Stanieria cyanosphaera]AFZ34725.1 hypothetical protein Sta7437_1154 [Stanieria cyanosphaera PCC 7437]